ncbi:MAG: hypothetical protein EU547_00115 [Promethearchaeota archaeon]|nr:MAG: hypothetical protein EU547_00115 [Candidatus Lokiarchaeota archaeon]
MEYKNLLNILEKEISPKEFKKSSEFYGIQYGNVSDETIIKSLMITIDLNLNVLHFAIKNKINFIVSQSPLLEKPIYKINKTLINKLNLLAQYPLNIFVLNSSFIGSEIGISETISKILYLKTDDVIEIKDKNGKKNPLGRVCYPIHYPNHNKQLFLKDLLQRIKTHFNLQIVQYVGELDRNLTKICIFPIETQDNILLKKTVEYECDTLITSNITYKQAIFAKEVGISLISIPYYKTSFFTLKKLYNYLSLEFPNDKIFFFEQKNPIDYYLS